MPVADAETALRDAVHAALTDAGCAAADIRAVAVTSQAQTFAVRAPDGHPKTPFISWRDTHCDAAPLVSALPAFGMHCSVAEGLPSLTVTKLAAMRSDGRAETEDLVLWLPAWFVMRLTGRAAVDPNLAAMSGLYSLRADSWWPAALDLCGIASRNLPRLIPLGGTAGLTTEAADWCGLPSGIPVTLAGNDQTAAAYGAGLHESESLLISLGTAQVAYVVRPELTDPVPGLMRGPYPGGRAYRLGADTCGAGTIHWARGMLPGCAGEAAFERAVLSAPPGCHGVRFVADGPNGTGHWTGTEASGATVADRARAVVETLVERLGDLLDRLGADDRQRQKILLCGGGAESGAWRGILRDRLHLRLTHVRNVSPSLGAARMARDCLISERKFVYAHV